MNCLESSETLTAYLDEELSPTERTELETHLGTCASCRQELESLIETASFFDSKIHSIEPDPRLWNGVRETIASMPAPVRPSVFRSFMAVPRWAAAAAGVAVVLAIGLGFREYVSYQASQVALDEYMSRYVQSREAQETAHRTKYGPFSQAGNQEYSDNPFIASSGESTYSNPFREQGQ